MADRIHQEEIFKKTVKFVLKRDIKTQDRKKGCHNFHDIFLIKNTFRVLLIIAKIFVRGDHCDGDWFLYMKTGASVALFCHYIYSSITEHLLGWKYNHSNMKISNENKKWLKCCQQIVIVEISAIYKGKPLGIRLGVHLAYIWEPYGCSCQFVTQNCVFIWFVKSEFQNAIWMVRFI